MAGSKPLLARRQSDTSLEQAEENALLTGEPQQRPDASKTPQRGWKFWREVGLFIWAFVATALVMVLAIVYQKSTTHHNSDNVTTPPTGKRNLIFMVSDGMGPTSLSLTRSFKQFTDGGPVGEQLVLDQHLIGQSRTRSSSSLVTDSAAGATAFSCASKSYNGAISVLPDGSPCGTVLEAAKRAGYMTGLVVTTRITDATPACFAAHVNMRSEEDRIAEQMIGTAHPLGRVVDLMLGAGRCHFLPNTTTGSCRADNKDVVAMAKDQGFSYVDNRSGFDGLATGTAVKLPLLGLFADFDIPYELDRRNENDIYPSLDEMARTAMVALSAATKDSDKGFFLMIEGSRIDHAGHANDPAAQVYEVLAYDKAMASVLEFLDNDSTQGVMVSTSDHETGGLAVARQLHISYPEYLWHPSALANTTATAERLSANYFAKRQKTSSKDELQSYITNTVSQAMGIKDATSDEISLLVNSPDVAPYTFADMISRRAQTGWSTHGHSGADVNIYSSNPSVAKALVGNHENTEVGDFLRDYLNVDVESVTKELRKKGIYEAGQTENWMGKVVSLPAVLDGGQHEDHYTGDFKKHKRCEICGA